MKIKATELKEAEVARIALVDRGAIREPFRLMKREGNGPMIDLSKLSAQSVKKAAPGIAFVAVEKSIGLAAATALIAGAGLDTKNVTEHEEATVFHQTDVKKMDASAVVRSPDGSVMIGLSNVEKLFDGVVFKTEDFTNLVKESSLPMAAGVAEVVRKGLESLGSKTNPNEYVANLYADAAAYTATVLSAVPAVALKFDATVMVEKAEVAAAPAKVETKEEPAAAVVETKEEPAAAAVETKDEPAKDEVKPDAKPEAAAPAAAPAAPDFAKLLADAMAPVMAQLTQVAKQAETSTTAVETLARKVNAQEERVKKAETLLGETEIDDGATTRVVEPDDVDDGFDDAHIDTAFLTPAQRARL